jgi:phage shock protein A
MEIETGELGSKLLNGGVWSALGALIVGAFHYWSDSKKDDSANTLGTLGVINEGSEILMRSLLQAQKQLDEQVRRYRKDLSDTDAKLDACEAKHRDAERRIEDLERKLVAAVSGSGNTTVNVNLPAAAAPVPVVPPTTGE